MSGSASVVGSTQLGRSVSAKAQAVPCILTVKETVAMINWKIDKEDLLIISDIADRALELNVDGRKQTIVMDLQACHTNGCPLRLNDLLAAEACDFLHDICGINHHINRENGKLEDCFSPRFSA
jgi:hypothetical protein